MAYPQSYDTLIGVDLDECVKFTHVLTDGIVDQLDEVETGKDLVVFVRYGTGVPVMDFIDPSNDTVLVGDVAGVYSSLTTLYKFTYAVPSTWPEGPMVIKVKSATSDLVFTHRVTAVSEESRYASNADLVAATTAINNKLTVVDSGLKQVIAEVTEDVQEIQTIHDQTGFKVII